MISMNPITAQEAPRKTREEARRLTPEGLASMRRSCLTREELCQVLQVGRDTISEMVAEGCPCVNLQRKPVTNSHANLRFDLDKVLLWLKSFSRTAYL